MLYPTELRGRRPDDTTPAPAMPPADGGPQRIVGITYSAPARIPAGQRAVTVFKRL